MAEQLLNLKVSAVRNLTEQIRELELRDGTGKALPAFTPGAHLRFTLPTRHGKMERCYSLVSSSHEGDCYRIAVHRSPTSGGGSAYMCEEVEAGTLLQALGPKNDFPLSENAEHHLLIAGGIGITPILAMAQKLRSAGQSFALHYVARTAENMAYAPLLLADSGLQAHLYFDHGNPAGGIPLTALLAEPRQNTHAYVCGPRPMIGAFLETGTAQGWQPEQLHFELFSTPPVAPGDRPLEVELARSRLTLKVGRDQSILDAVIAAGVDPLFDCRRGECGSCAVGVIDGIPDHRDYALNAQQKAGNKTMCICVSRARGERLVLDI